MINRRVVIHRLRLNPVGYAVLTKQFPLPSATTKGPDPNRNWLGPGPFLCVARW